MPEPLTLEEVQEEIKQLAVELRQLGKCVQESVRKSFRQEFRTVFDEYASKLSIRQDSPAKKDVSTNPDGNQPRLQSVIAPPDVASLKQPSATGALQCEVANEQDEGKQQYRKKQDDPTAVGNPNTNQDFGFHTVSYLSIKERISAPEGAAVLMNERPSPERLSHGTPQPKAAHTPEPSPEPAVQTSDYEQLGLEFEMTTPLVEPAGPPDVLREARRPWSCRDMYRHQGDSAQGAYYQVHDPHDSDMVHLQVDEDGHEIMDPEAAERLPEEIKTLEAKVAAARASLEDLDSLWKNRRKPYEEDIISVGKEIDKLNDELEHARAPKYQEPPPPGPVALDFVDSELFGLICNLVVVLNLVAMVMGPKFKRYAAAFKLLDHVFLTWYVVELTVKGVYYQCNLICGRISVVWCNWLDLGIVISGVVDQWILPLLMKLNGGHLDIDTSGLRMLRALRLFRIMRFFKIIKAFLKSDFAWTEGATFEWCMAGVIAANSIAMSIELDIPWAGWFYVENFLQLTYTFELSVRLKRHWLEFFLDMDNMVWNYLDLIMVIGGAMDLWLVPMMYEIRGLILGGTVQRETSFSGALRILKIMRILRVLRLVRLLRMVKPLYRLLIGVIASVKAMQWVMVLTFLTLYACSIVFTDLVGKGLMVDGEVDGMAVLYFGTVPKSLFSLFKLMNGDMSVVAPITGSICGQLLFAVFMVVSNWAILAVLTAVVSDNMISTSQKANEEDEARKIELEHQRRIRRLTALFKEIDHTHTGTIHIEDWQKMLAEKSMHRELCDATGLQTDDLNDYFECLAKDPKQDAMEKQLTKSGQLPDLSLDYQTFIEALKNEGVLADKRSIMHLMKQLRTLESQVKTEFEELGLVKHSIA